MNRSLPSTLATCMVTLAFAAPAQSPRLLGDTSPGPTGSILGGISSAGRSAMFVTSDTATPGSWNVWRTDATPAGTWPTGANASGLLLACGDRFVSFEASVPASGMLDEVVAIDGRTPGTTRLGGFAGLFGAPGGRLPDRVVFAADDGVHGMEPWVTDGTASGTRLLADVVTGAIGSFAGSFQRVGQVVYFFTFLPPTGQPQLWSTDGTAGGTRPVATSISYPPQTHQRPLLAAAGDRLFIGIPPTTITPFELLVVDGPAGPVRTVLSSQPPNAYAPGWLVPFRDGVLFAFEDAAGVEPWISNGTVTGTHRLLDLEPGPSSSSPQLFDTGDPSLFFAHVGGSDGLYVTDGTAQGTTRIHNYRLGNWWVPWGPIGVFLDAGSNRYLFFDGTPSQPNADLWETDKTAAGTRIALPSATALGIHLGQLIYPFDDGVHGREPWARGIGPVATKSGFGCGLASRTPSLEASAPRLGTTLALHGRSAPPSVAAILVLGPVPDAPTRFPGGCVCQIDLLQMVTLDAFVTAANDWSRTIPIPVLPALAGVTVALQGWFGPSSNPLGLEVSNGVHLTFDI